MTEINEISEIIKKDNLRTVLIIEKDSYFQKKLIDYLEENIPRDIYSSNVNLIDIEKINDISTILENMNTYPLGHNKRFIIILNLHEANEALVNNLIKFNLSPNKFAKIFYFSKKLIKKFSVDREYEFNHNNMRKIFIKDMLKDNNIKLSKILEELIIDKFPESRIGIENEVEKIKTFVNKGKVDENKIKELYNNYERTVFAETYSLDKYINNKNFKELLSNFNKTKFEKNIFMEIGRIAWKYRQYLKIKILQGRNKTDNEIINATKISKFQFKYIKAETNKLKMSDLQKTLRELQRADKLLKSSDISQKTIIFNLLKNIAN